MLQQVFNAAQLATLPANKFIDLSDQRDGYFRVINLSPHLFEIWDDAGIIRGVSMPWNPTWIAVGKAMHIEGVTLHGVATLGPVPDAGAQKVLYEVTTKEPPPMSYAAPPFVEIAGANKAVLLTNVSVSNAAATRLDSGLASRKTVRLTNDSGNAQPVAIGYTNAVTVAVPPAAATDGILLRPGNSMTFGIGPSLQLWGKANVAATILGVEELA